jgi:hypothetical protein
MCYLGFQHKLQIFLLPLSVQSTTYEISYYWGKSGKLKEKSLIHENAFTRRLVFHTLSRLLTIDRYKTTESYLNSQYRTKSTEVSTEAHHPQRGTIKENIIR